MSTADVHNRDVPADLVEATPMANALGYWLLASPLLVFAGWLWVDVFAQLSPVPWYWVDLVLALVIYVFVLILPLGVGVFFLISSAPRIFQNAGWEVHPLEPVRESEQYLVRYTIQRRLRAANTWGRAWLRAAQGWVYIEIVTIFLAAIAAIPLFFSAVDFGFGR